MSSLAACPGMGATRDARRAACGMRAARLCAAFVLGSCTGVPTGDAVADLGALRVRFSTSVVAAAGAWVDASITYTLALDGTPIVMAQDSVLITTGSVDERLTLIGDVAPCVTAAGQSPCALRLQVRLTRDGVLLDESIQQLSVSATVAPLNATN